ncbi:MAG: DUF309 domain-containing protein [Gammaproteobacteria bacterium]|nr:DUF309 domain-containing protein [Gammaproteobacteria bacterium]
MSSTPPRYSLRAFPPYAYVPGRDPHPVRDPAGHSYGRFEREPCSFAPARWHECDDYLYGVDLFNHGYYWEAHEAIEGAWIAAGRDSADGRFLQGLIQLAVALLKHVQGHAQAAASLCRDGGGRLDRHPRLGIDAETLRRQVEDHLAGRRAAPPRIVLGPPVTPRA